MLVLLLLKHFQHLCFLAAFRGIYRETLELAHGGDRAVTWLMQYAISTVAELVTELDWMGAA